MFPEDTFVQKGGSDKCTPPSIPRMIIRFTFKQGFSALNNNTTKPTLPQQVDYAIDKQRVGRLANSVFDVDRLALFSPIDKLVTNYKDP